MSEVLSDEETATLIRRLLLARGERGAMEEEMQVVLDWAHQARVDCHLVDLLLAGKLVVDVDPDNHLIFKASAEAL